MASCRPVPASQSACPKGANTPTSRGSWLRRAEALRFLGSSSGQRRGGVHAAGQSSGRKGHQGWALPALSTSREPAAPPELCGDPGDPDLSYLAGGLWAAGLGEALMPELGSPLPPSGSANPHLARAGEQGQKKKLLKKHAAALPGTRRGRRRPALEGAPGVQEAPFPR